MRGIITNDILYEENLRDAEEFLEHEGRSVLDGAPIRCRIFPGKKAEPYGGPLPERSLPCPGCFCLQSRSDDGAVLLWDTRQTLAARCAAAGSPVIVLQAEWDRLQE